MSETAVEKLRAWVARQPMTGASGGGNHTGLDLFHKALSEIASERDAENGRWMDQLAKAREEGRKEGRAEGFAAAREMAAGRYDTMAANLRADAEKAGNEKLRLERHEFAEQWESEARIIRAMQDGRAGGEGCTACGHVFHDDNKCPGCTANGTQCIRDDS